MPGRHPFAVSNQRIFLGTLLQCALRVLLIAFVAVTLVLEPPSRAAWVCALVVVAYVATVALWAAWALRPSARAAGASNRLVTLLVLAADIAAMSVLTVLTGLTSPDDWTSDVLRIGLFLIPLIAAAQLNPDISAAIAVPTVGAFLAAAWITQSANNEPWASIILSTVVLAGLAGGSVALSRIQKSKVETIEQLARQRRELLEELVGLEKRERETLAQRVHDGALQYVLVARQDVEDWQAGIPEAPDRVLRALNEASQLLRSVARELHPDVLSRLGLKSALTHLAGDAQRPGLAVEVDARTWPEDERFEAEHIIYSAARELLTNVIKHAKASNTIIQLSREADTALLRISDDGVGISQEALTKSSAEGHIGLPSIRTKILAAGGHFDMRATSPGTEIRISMPLRHATSETDVRPRAVTLV